MTGPGRGFRSLHCSVSCSGRPLHPPRVKGAPTPPPPATFGTRSVRAGAFRPPLCARSFPTTYWAASLVCKRFFPLSFFLVFFGVLLRLTLNNFLLVRRLSRTASLRSPARPPPPRAAPLPRQRCPRAPRLAPQPRAGLQRRWGGRGRGAGAGGGGPAGGRGGPASSRAGPALGTRGGPAAPPGPRAPRPGGEGLAHRQRRRAGPLPRPSRSQPSTPAGPT